MSLGYTPVQSTKKYKTKHSSFCATFRAWQNGDDEALDHLLAQGYDHLFLPKAERLAVRLPAHRERHPRKLLRQAWTALASTKERTQIQSFSHFLSCFQGELERVLGPV